MSFFQTILAALFPDYCVGCSRKGSLLCAECASKLPSAPTPEHDFITSVFAYQDFRVRALVRKLKYKNTRHAADIFASGMAEALSEFLGEEGLTLGSRNVLLVPIPLSKKRYQTRGYNQAELLARKILTHTTSERIQVDTTLLKKIIDTKQQADMKVRTLRLQNLGDCFRVDSSRKAAGGVIVLIDDVTTTGTTLMAARKTLRAAGFKKVYALTAAH